MGKGQGRSVGLTMKMRMKMKIVADRNIPFLEGRIAGAELVMMPAAEIDREAVRDADASPFYC